MTQFLSKWFKPLRSFTNLREPNWYIFLSKHGNRSKMILKKEEITNNIHTLKYLRFAENAPNSKLNVTSFKFMCLGRLKKQECMLCTPRKIWQTLSPSAGRFKHTVGFKEEQNQPAPFLSNSLASDKNQPNVRGNWVHMELWQTNLLLMQTLCCLHPHSDACSVLFCSCSACCSCRRAAIWRLQPRWKHAIVDPESGTFSFFFFHYAFKTPY